MFANKSAIETLINSDTKATADEKQAVLAVLHGENMGDAKPASKVLSITDAANYIGKSKKTIYHLLRTGTLQGFYSGKTHARATGITRASLEAAVSRSRR